MLNVQVHKHIASVKKAATPVYISCLLVESGYGCPLHSLLLAHGLGIVPEVCLSITPVPQTIVLCHGCSMASDGWRMLQAKSAPYSAAFKGGAA